MSRAIERRLPLIVVSPLFAVSLFFVYGFIAWTIWISFTKSGVMPVYDFHGLAQYERLWATPRWYVALKNLFVFSGLFIAISMGLGILLAILLGALNGYALTKWRFRGADIVFALMLFGAFIPFQVVLLPMARTLGQLGLAGTVPGLILVHTVYGLAFTTLFFRNFFIGVSDGIVNAAKVDGAGFFGIFFRIVLPMSLPAIVVTVIWQFTQIWNDFLFGVAFTVGDSNPVTVALNNVVNTSTGVKEYNVDMAAAIIAGLPTLLVYVVAGAYFVRGLSAGAVKG
ncbi:carbohydrate ABC transporter permease [Rhodovulum sp.]|uniref:carbohydrate ABC transporter permease n=1 Tax=Rhodovulum sp. TaxID=34009 RepID=UPI00257E737B|nr:carbohydrate ABC transporter permease [Rhodovulum sp.]